MKKHVGSTLAALGISGVCAFLGCGGDGAGSEEAGLTDGAWRLAAFVDGTTATPQGMDPRPRLQFRDDFLVEGDSMLTGHGGCGEFAGTWTHVGEGRLDVDLGIRETPACDAFLRAREDSLLARLVEVSTYRLDSDSLWLLDTPGGRGLLLTR